LFVVFSDFRVSWHCQESSFAKQTSGVLCIILCVPSRSVAFLGYLLGEDRKMACAMNAAAMMVGVAPAQAVGAVCGNTSSRSTTASKSSMLFNNGGLHVTKLAHSSRARTMQPLRVRAEDEV